jgi:GT2 family glycosyltransferase
VDLDQLPALAARENVTVVRYPIQVGCAGGWNEAIRLAPAAPFWLLVNNDIAFFPGQLRQMAATFVRQHRDTPLFASYFFEATCFAVSNQVVQAVGVFDENIFPGGYEDTDFERRLVKHVERFNLPPILTDDAMGLLFIHVRRARVVEGLEMPKPVAAADSSALRAPRLQAHRFTNQSYVSGIVGLKAD